MRLPASWAPQQRQRARHHEVRYAPADVAHGFSAARGYDRVCACEVLLYAGAAMRGWGGRREGARWSGGGLGDGGLVLLEGFMFLELFS